MYQDETWIEGKESYLVILPQSIYLFFFLS